MLACFTRIRVPKIGFLPLALGLALGCGSKNSRDPDENPDASRSRDALDGNQGPSGFGSQAELSLGNSELANVKDIISRVGLKAYHDRGFRGQNVTIAVLDNGFMGLQESLGQRLPPWVKVEPAPRPEMQPTNHGTKMAEIAYAVASGSRFYRADTNAPKILLFNANGYTNLEAAVNGAIQAKADIVLYAQVWEFGGNWDGGGFLNRLVSKATQAGILWVNASGNMGLSTYSGPIRVNPVTNQVALPDTGNSLRFTVPQDGTPVKIVLAWNDFRDTKEHRTEQDLDLMLASDNGDEQETSKLNQTGARNTDVENYSAHAREIIQTVMKRGVYRLFVSSKTQNFTPQSRLRLSIDGNGVRMFSATPEESLPIPADNPEVLAIGATDVDYSGRNNQTSFNLRKPELNIKSYVLFNDGIGHHGTSAATAIAVGALAVYHSAWGKLNRKEVVSLLERGRLSSKELKLPAPPLGPTR